MEIGTPGLVGVLSECDHQLCSDEHVFCITDSHQKPQDLLFVQATLNTIPPKARSSQPGSLSLSAHI